jgi:hypothetical protein
MILSVCFCGHTALLLRLASARQVLNSGATWLYHKGHFERAGRSIFDVLQPNLLMLPVSYIAPSREVRILVGALFGVHFLKESDRRRRVIAACVMLLGVHFLAVS